MLEPIPSCSQPQISTTQSPQQNTHCSSGKEIGELSEECGDITVQWTVKDICSFSKAKESFCSRYFFVSGCRWYLEIYPCGEKGSKEYISLYLCLADSCVPPKSVEYSLGWKKSNGTVEHVCEYSYFFRKKNTGFGADEFLKRSDLVQRKEELAPSGHLTVVCTMRVNDSTNSTARLDKLSKDFEDLYLSKEGHDVILNIEQEKIPAHKFLLAARSSVFKTMFEVAMKEKDTGVVDIEDCNLGPFKDFLWYLYSGKLGDLSGNVFELCRIADKYNVQPLVEACVGFITFNLSLENMFDALIIADLFEQQNLKKVIQKLFNKKFRKIIFSSAWEAFSKGNISLVNYLLKGKAVLEFSEDSEVAEDSEDSEDYDSDDYEDYKDYLLSNCPSNNTL